MIQKDLENRRRVVPKRGKVTIKMFKKGNIATFEDPDSSTEIETDEEEEDTGRSRQSPAKRKYKYVEWKAKSKSNPYHMSIVDRNDPCVAIDAQDVPGGCLLCSERMYLSTRGECTRHYANVHYKHSTTLAGKRMLMCKCDDVKPTGADGRMRNRHYHCINCFKPAQSLVLLSKHLFTKHGYTPKQLRHLKYCPRK